jgi:hypothetical protein
VIQLFERRYDDVGAFSRILVPSRPSDQDPAPLAVITEPVLIAQRNRAFGAGRHMLDVTSHLMQQRGVRERKRVAVRMFAPFRESDAPFAMRQRGVLIAEQPERVRVPCVREHAEIRPERGSLRIPLVVGGQ